VNNPNPVALITGAARRIGAVIAQTLHQQGYNIVLHYNNSQVAAEKLAAELNQQRHNSCTVFAANLSDLKQIDTLATHAMSQWQRIDLLINNASSFYPTPLTAATEQQWDDLFASNSKGPYFLSQALASTLKKHRGSIINIADIHTGQPLRDHSIYCMAKAANRMMTKSLAKELAPDVRVNGIAPGAIMWPEKRATLSAQQKQNIVAKTPLNRTGAPEDIAQLAHFLAAKASYITGEVIAVDGGRKLS
jgi:pteridine reductase